MIKDKINSNDSKEVVETLFKYRNSINYISDSKVLAELIAEDISYLELIKLIELIKLNENMIELINHLH